MIIYNLFCLIIECDHGTPIVACSFKPCAQLHCLDYPDAVCKPNFCGGCNAEFYIDGSKVQCRELYIHIINLI